jgi:hypothetical protein
MAVAVAPASLGVKAPDFRLPATDGRNLRLADVAGRNGTVVVIICNHCPYVRRNWSADRRRQAPEEGGDQFRLSSNDAGTYREEVPNMKRFAEQHGVPRLAHDETKPLSYLRAVCAPDFFGISAASCRISRPPRRGAARGTATRRPPMVEAMPDRGLRRGPKGANWRRQENWKPWGGSAGRNPF